MSVELGNYKGNPTIALTWNDKDKFPFTFGAKKARLILANLDAIRAFVASIPSDTQSTEKE